MNVIHVTLKPASCYYLLVFQQLMIQNYGKIYLIICKIKKCIELWGKIIFLCVFVIFLFYEMNVTLEPALCNCFPIFPQLEILNC